MLYLAAGVVVLGILMVIAAPEVDDPWDRLLAYVGIAFIVTPLVLIK